MVAQGLRKGVIGRWPNGGGKLATLATSHPPFGQCLIAPFRGHWAHIAVFPSRFSTWSIYGDGSVKPVFRCKSMRRKSARTSSSPSASVDLPHLSRRSAGVSAFCRISLEPEAEGDRPTACLRSSWGRRERDALNHLFGIVRSGRTSPHNKDSKDATIHIPDDPRGGGRQDKVRGHPAKSSRPPAIRLDKTTVPPRWPANACGSIA